MIQAALLLADAAHRFIPLDNPRGGCPGCVSPALRMNITRTCVIFFSVLGITLDAAGRVLEAVPIVREFSGSLHISCRRPA